jgi:hypothetical protein
MPHIDETLYNQLVEYFDNRADADGSSEGYSANKEMKILSELKSAEAEITWETVHDFWRSFIEYVPIVVTDGKNNFTSYGLREEMKVALVWSDKKRAIKAMHRLEKWKEKYKDLLQQDKDFNENSIANIDNQ